MEKLLENPLSTCELPEGFSRSEVRGIGPTLECRLTKTTINWTRHYEKLSDGKAPGPFHVQNYRRGKLDRWCLTLEEAVKLASQS